MPLHSVSYYVFIYLFWHVLNPVSAQDLKRDNWLILITQFWMKCGTQASNVVLLWLSESLNSDLMVIRGWRWGWQDNLLLSSCFLVCNFLLLRKASLVAQMVKCRSAMQETWVQSLGWEDPLEKEMAAHSSTLAWKIPWMEEPGRLLFMGLQRFRHDWVTSLSLY